MNSAHQTPGPSPWDRLRRIGEVPTRSIGERAALLAAVAWADAKGELWPSLDAWAALAGLSTRSLRRALKSLEARGIVQRVNASRGGRRCTSVYRIAALDPASGRAEYPDTQTGYENAGDAKTRTPSPGIAPRNPDIHAPKPGHTRPETRTYTTRNPDTVSGEQQGTSKKQQPTATDVVAVDAFSRLRIEDLRGHVHATPERLAWIEREAPRAKKPTGWARACIVEGWAVPQPTPEDLEAAKRARLEAVDRAYRRLTRDQRRALLDRARTEHPRLRERTDADFELIAAAKYLLAGQLGIAHNGTTMGHTDSLDHPGQG